MKTAVIALLAVVLVVPGCAALRTMAGSGDGGGRTWTESSAPAAGPQARPGDGGAMPRIVPAGARTAAAFDRTSAEEKAAALAAPAGGVELGKVTVSLGNPAEQGFWLRSGLVASARPGVVRVASGASAQVDLLPSAGGGAQMSLATFRALGLGLTDLPEVTVLGR